ncbi:MAG: hypothetical protein WC850_03200 [Candidatus Gracilibacteria bacterium]
MKKFIISLSFLLFILFGMNDTFATSNLYNITVKKPNLEMYKLYKQAILTRHQVQVDYNDGVKMNNKLEKYFIGLYFKTDRTIKLKSLEKKTIILIEKYDNKILNTKQKKALNLIKNVYYRTVIELNK